MHFSCGLFMVTCMYITVLLLIIQRIQSFDDEKYQQINNSSKRLKNSPPIVVCMGVCCQIYLSKISLVKICNLCHTVTENTNSLKSCSANLSNVDNIFFAAAWPSTSKINDEVSKFLLPNFLSNCGRSFNHDTKVVEISLKM